MDRTHRHCGRAGTTVRAERSVVSRVRPWEQCGQREISVVSGYKAPLMEKVHSRTLAPRPSMEHPRGGEHGAELAIAEKQTFEVALGNEIEDQIVCTHLMSNLRCGFHNVFVVLLHSVTDNGML